MSVEKHVTEFLEALHGNRGDLDFWLECNNEAEVRAAIIGAIAEYKKDAERYRFLLDQNSDYAVCHWVDGDWFALGITKEVIDSEIDAAMEKVK